MKIRVDWGYLAYIFAFYCYVSTISSVIYLVQVRDIVSFLFTLPVIPLNLLAWSISVDLFNMITKGDRERASITQSHIKIGTKELHWEDIKSISFHYCGAKKPGVLPSIQRLFVLDKEGNEYSQLIGISYLGHRKDIISEVISYLASIHKSHLVSDWAHRL